MRELGPAGPLPRILVYCHNVHGLGHVTRSLRIVRELAPGTRCECRLVTGCSFLEQLTVDPAVSVVRLPGLRQGERGLVPVDGGSIGSTLLARSRRIHREVEEWRPHVVLVDHNPVGLIGELAATLDAGRTQGSPRFVWGVRDLWGSNEYLEERRVFKEGPAAAGGRLARYHSAIAYTDPRWIDTFDLYRHIDLPPRRASVGFVTAPPPEVSPPGDGPPRVVAVCGGGAGAPALMELLISALAEDLSRRAVRLRFVVGPFSSSEAIRGLGADLPGIEVWSVGAVEDAIADASLVVSRVGYNTAYSLAQTSLPIVFVPTGKMNREQEMRGDRLAGLPGVWQVDETAPDALPRMTESIRRGLADGLVERRLPFAVDGASRAADWVLEVAAETLGT